MRGPDRSEPLHFLPQTNDCVHDRDTALVASRVRELWQEAPSIRSRAVASAKFAHAPGHIFIFAVRPTADSDTISADQGCNDDPTLAASSNLGCDASATSLGVSTKAARRSLAVNVVQAHFGHNQSRFVTNQLKLAWSTVGGRHYGCVGMGERPRSPISVRAFLCP